MLRGGPSIMYQWQKYKGFGWPCLCASNMFNKSHNYSTLLVPWVILPLHVSSSAAMFSHFRSVDFAGRAGAR